MAKAYSARCLVIKHTKLAETDMIVTLLSEEGEQIRAVAKGLRKPGNRIGARLELFSEVDLLLHEGRSLDTVREVKSVQTNAALRESLEASAAAHVISELLEKLTRDGAGLGERVYAMSSMVLRALAQCEPSSAALLTAAFMIKTMAMQGFSPAVRECALCGKTLDRIEHFDIGYGGALCEDCAASLSVSASMYPHARSWMPSLMYATFDELMSCESYPAMELVDLSHMWVMEHAGFQLKSVSFFKSLLP